MGISLDFILTALQNGVEAINNLNITLQNRISSVSTAASAPTTASSGFPLSMDACVRMASNATARQYGIGCYGGGNGLWLYSPTRSQFEMTPFSGAGQTILSTSCTVDGVPNQNLAANTLYYVYAKEALTFGGFAEIDHSVTGPVPGDPLGATTVLGWQFKNDGTRNQRLVGAVQKNIPGDLWAAGSRGVFFNGIGSYYQRQRLNYQIQFTGQPFNNTVSLQIINSNNYINAMLWGDGAEPSCQLSGNVTNDTNAVTIRIGVGIDGAAPAANDFLDIYCATALQAYPFCLNVSAGDLGTGNHQFDIYGVTSAGNASINLATFTLNLNV